MTLSQKYEAARYAARMAELTGKSVSTINRRYRAMFAAEDALKAAGLWS
jgi:hypothetical protein